MKSNLFENICFLTLCLFIQSCLEVGTITPGNKTENSAKIFTFLGDPWSGKTTIIDSLVGKKVSKTNTLYPHNNLLFLETSPIRSLGRPWDVGLAPFLGFKTKYYLFFIIKLTNTKLHQEDLAEINAIMDSLNSTNKEFNIIINRLTGAEAKFFKNNPSEMAKLFKKINAGKYKTKNIYFLRKDNELEDENKDFLTLNQSFKDFIYNKSLPTVINKEEIPDIKYSVYQTFKKDISDEFDLINNSTTIFDELDVETQKIVNELLEQI